MKNFIDRFLGVVLLGTACLFAFAGGSSVGKPVDEQSAQQIRGGSCDAEFYTNNERPVYCEGSGCHKQRPNEERYGSGGTSGYTSESCAGAVPGFGCDTFNKPASCAKPKTAVGTGVVIG